ncbi:hypothetical protein [Methylobacillus flagellatus]|uniref:hypothetical protein n=1 Tax=Methylobacillus flagellatus TaxID=405 RepID=UPI0014853C3C|nr:hypothetical protein [Methylobacillus flagellatus]
MRRARQLALCTVSLLGLLMAEPASATWLSLCDANTLPPDAQVLASYASTSGSKRALVLTDTPLQCNTVQLPVPASQVSDGRLLAPGLAKAIQQGFSLTGQQSADRFLVSEVAAPETTSDPSQLPLDVALLLQAKVVAFGHEERVNVSQHKGQLQLSCQAGHSPAGVVLQLPYRGLPGQVAMQIRAQYRASAGFEIGISDSQRQQRGDPLTLGALPAHQSLAALAIAGHTSSIPIPMPTQPLDTGSVQSFTIACPVQAATLALQDLRILPAQPAKPPGRALWVWQPAAWMDEPHALLNKLNKAGADSVFITVPVDLDSGLVAQPDALAAFVKLARQQVVKVWAVVGDPGAVIADQRAAFARLPAAYRQYNRAVAADAQLAGVQFDIEPYLNPGYALDPAAWHEAYISTLTQLKQVADMPVDIAIPFWWATQATPQGMLLDRLAPLVDVVSVMNYRTQATQIKQLAQPFLEWAARHGRQVRIGLESGPIPDEVQRHYRPWQTGTALMVTLGAQQVLLQLTQPVTVKPAQAGLQPFRFSHETPVPGSATTFAGKRSALLALLPELETLWSAWPGFAGIALHEFEP